MATRGEVGPAADVYALGATLYALVTGRPPFQAATAMDTVMQVRTDEPVPPRRLNPTVDGDVETICLKCLQKDPARRYASAAALGEDLRRHLDGEPILARRVTAIERLIKWARRRPAIAGLSVSLLVVGILGFGGILWQWRRAANNFAEAERLRGTALVNLEEATTQRTIAQAKSREANEKAETLERQLYINRISLAQRDWTSRSSVAVDESLDLCPPQLRGWEWSYLRRLCHMENLSIASTPSARMPLCPRLGEYAGWRSAPTVGEWPRPTRSTASTSGIRSREISS